MKARIIAVAMMLATLIPLNVPLAQAKADPVVAVSSFFTALNEGDGEAAVATFTPDAVATLVRGETYNGPDGISHMVELMEHPGRNYEIIQAYMAGDSVTAVVEVSDQGISWGEDTIVIEVKDGKLQSFHEKSFQLRLGA